MTIDHILTLLLAVPAIGLLPLYVFRNDPRSVKQVAVVTTLFERLLSLVMRAQFDVGDAGSPLVDKGDGLPSLAIRYLVGAAEIPLRLVPVTTRLTYVSV